MRSSNGCWTCRLRRKKCDEKYPVCDVCAALHITCHFEQDRPEWMDGGARQERMHEQLKREVKERAQRRGGGQSAAVRISGDRATFAAEISDARSDGTEPHPQSSSSPSTSAAGNQSWPLRGTGCTLTNNNGRSGHSFGQPDTILLMFYLDHVFPFLYPFYRPSPVLEGGRAWVLEMLLGSPVVRQAALCQSSYFFSLAQGRDKCNSTWETVLAQTRDAFEVLRHALQVIDDPGLVDHLHGAVRILTSIMQVQRFDVSVLSFHNSQTHLNAAIALFLQLLNSAGVMDAQPAAAPDAVTSSFNAVMSHLALPPPPPCTVPGAARPVRPPPSAEQAAFRFSSTLLILDDIIASTVLQEEPKLYQHHRCLLLGIDGDSNNTADAPIDIEGVMGCQNWVLLQLGEIAALDAWKQRCKRAGNLDVMELVHRAATIKNALETHLTQLEAVPAPANIQGNCTSLLDCFDMGDHSNTTHTHTSQSQTPLVTRVWAHAALLYLFVVVSGWQPASTDVRYHVGQIIELLAHRASPPVLLRTMVWPFCVAGCLAEPAQEAQLRAMVEALQPPRVFGTVRKALEIMENVWRCRNTEVGASRDLATCFRSPGGDLVLLV
ncbi:hypothetical protein SLS62_000488 [Diatrype stigma]|uniref:Zn(2)-C6 fungal-type domain-containing protein n=1 Tax=Diatrype stigma TaxID=117547 RepID=A0AAN9YSK3_9PEZI